VPNERLAESTVRDHFKNDPLFSSIKFEEQQTRNARAARCLAKASKSGRGMGGRPEFIITFPTQNMDYLIVVECKASVDKHESEHRNKPKDYAVDGALHYSRFLSAEFSVISIAVSGEDAESSLVSCFLQTKGAVSATELPDKKLLSIYDYVSKFRNDQFSYNLKDVNIIEKAVKLNNDFHACSISESMRNTLVSGILLALQDTTFLTSYPVAESSHEIADQMMMALEKVLKKAGVKKLDDMMGVYRGIFNEALVQQSVIKRKGKSISSVEFFKEIISYLQQQVFPLMHYEEAGYDILGRFYTEFIRYAASKQKQGLVLTPAHVTDLFCDLVQLRADDVVYDPCCGTGGFLIAAMQRMFRLAGNDESRKLNIRDKQLLGTELRAEMFTFACSNMMLRGDGRSNIDRGDCFAAETLERIKKLRPTVAFLNPPYDHGTADQLSFVEKALEVVAPQHGRVAAIVQMSCAVGGDGRTKAARKRLLDSHTLKAVISMPDNLFNRVGVVACVMVFEAGSPNAGKKTWFGYLKDDGFVKNKNRGRIDSRGEWQHIKSSFLDSYVNNSEVAGLSVKKEVVCSDEWCAEAYMQTDYSKITQADFETAMRKYAIFKEIGLAGSEGGEEDDDEEDQ